MQSASSLKQGIRAQYLLTATVTDGVAPAVVGTTFPGGEPLGRVQHVANPSGAWSYGWASTLARRPATCTTAGPTARPERLVRRRPRHHADGRAQPLGRSLIHFSSVSIPSGPARVAPRLRRAEERGAVDRAGRRHDPASEPRFTGLDFTGPTSTDVHVLVNGVSVYDAMSTATATRSARSYTGSLTVQRGRHRRLRRRLRVEQQLQQRHDRARRHDHGRHGRYDSSRDRPVLARVPQGHEPAVGQQRG